MGGADLLRQLRGAGLAITLTPTGGLHVAPRYAITEGQRAAIRAKRDALVLAVQLEPATKPARRSGNPLMTPEQGDECHEGCWNDAEIDAFTTREARFTRLGREADAGHLAERLTLRDRQRDDRRLCLECSSLADNGRCHAAAHGRIPGADRRLEPVATILQRCPAFWLAPGLK
jgi:hypothetical protein